MADSLPTQGQIGARPQAVRDYWTTPMVCQDCEVVCTREEAFDAGDDEMAARCPSCGADEILEIDA